MRNPPFSQDASTRAGTSLTAIPSLQFTDHWLWQSSIKCTANSLFQGSRVQPALYPLHSSGERIRLQHTQSTESLKRKIKGHKQLWTLTGENVCCRREMLGCQVNATHTRYQGKERQMQDMNCRDFTTREISGSTAFDLCTFAMRHFIWESALSSAGLTSCSTAWPVTQSITEMGTQKPLYRKHIRLR